MQASAGVDAVAGRRDVAGLLLSIVTADFAGAFSILVVNLDSSLLQGLTPPKLQGRIASIASLGKGLQPMAAAAASEANGWLSHSPLKGDAFSFVQCCFAMVLIVCAALLWEPLRRLEMSAGSPVPEPFRA